LPMVPAAQAGPRGAVAEDRFGGGGGPGRHFRYADIDL